MALLRFEAEGLEFAKILRTLEQFIQTVKGQNNFWEQNAFLTCSWIINQKIRIQIEKTYWDLETCRKSQKMSFTIFWDKKGISF